MESKSIIVNGQRVVCYEDGSIERPESRRTDCRWRSFGCESEHGYMRIYVNGKQMYVHRIIAKAFLGDDASSLEVDHINGDRSDNRTENLRIVTHQQNSRAHFKDRKHSSSVYRGVCWDKARNRWKAGIYVDGKHKHLGRFRSEIEAARKYDDAAIEAGYLPEALNFPFDRV